MTTPARRRLARHLFALIAALSSALATAVCVLWVLSYGACHAARLVCFTIHPEFERRHTWYGLSAAGGVKLWLDADNCAPGMAARSDVVSFTTGKARVYPFFGPRSSAPGRSRPPFMQRRGFELRNRVSDEGAQPPSIVRGVIVPHWFLLLLFSAAPALWAWREVPAARHARRRRLGLCGRCGYDLRATPGACPECGNIAGPTEEHAGAGGAA